MIKYQSFPLGQKGVAPVFVVLLAVVVLGLGGIWIYKSNQTNSTNQPLVNESPIESAQTQPTSTPSTQSTQPTNPKGTVAPTQKPSPTPSLTPSPKPEVSMSATKDGNEYRFFASWKNIPNPTNGDWLGIYPFGEKGDSPIDGRIYLESCADRGQTDVNKAGPTSGSCPMYTKLDSGTYEVRLYSNDTTQRLATSGLFKTPY